LTTAEALDDRMKASEEPGDQRDAKIREKIGQV